MRVLSALRVLSFLRTLIILSTLRTLIILNTLRTLIILRILRILITPARLIAAIVEPGVEHALFDAAFLDEAVLHGLQQTLEHVACLVDEGDAEVGYLLVVHLLYLAGIVFLYLLAACILAHGVVA